MPTVYTFSRTNNQILQELMQVFSSGRGTAREQWSAQAEMLVEPVGWDALWKLSKEFCKKFDVRFPCIAYVTVTAVEFESLSASVDVLSVQHEFVTLPESVGEVPLVDLWPTTEQREQAVNANTTAEFIDLLRFYYTELWMPWDDQDDKVLLSTTVEDRFQLWADIHNGTIPNCVSRSIVLLRSSAINAHQRIQVLDSSLLDDEDMDNDDDSLLPPNYITHCAELNAKLDGLMAKWTLYENPVIRKQYLAKMQTKWTRDKSKKHVVVLWRGGSLQEFEDIYSFLQPRVSKEQNLAVLASAEEALTLQPEELIVCSKHYDVPEMPLMDISVLSSQGATLTADDMRSCLLMLSGTCRLQNLTLECSRVNTAVVMRHGTLRVTQCCFTDDTDTSQSDFAQGIVAQAGASIILEDCTFDNFYSGIVVNKGAEVELKKCKLRSCGVGVQMYSGSRVKLTGCTIAQCREQSIRCEMDISAPQAYTQVEGLKVMSNCKIGTGDLDKEILVVRQEANII